MPLVRQPLSGAAPEVCIPVTVIVATAVAVAGEGRDHRSALCHVNVPGVRLPPVRRLVRVAPSHPKTLAQVVLDVRFAVAFAVGRLDGCHRVFRDLHLLDAVRILSAHHVGTLPRGSVKSVVVLKRSLAGWRGICDVGLEHPVVRIYSTAVHFLAVDSHCNEHPRRLVCRVACPFGERKAPVRACTIVRPLMDAQQCKDVLVGEFATLPTHQQDVAIDSRGHWVTLRVIS